MAEPEYIDPGEVRPGPIRHDSLSPELLEKIEAVFQVVGPYLDTTLEQFEIGFMRDMNPENEVAVWRSIVAAWTAYHEEYLGDELLSVDDERRLLVALIVISTGGKDLNALDLPVEVGRRLLACYNGLGEAE